jgi:nucleoside-diphosphate-sugar epimerase
MKSELPTIIVTGASGIVGKSFLEAAKEQFKIFAIARRSQMEVQIKEHPNIKWIQVDISNQKNLNQVLELNIKEKIDYVLHLAGYYDFDNKDNIAYVRTNINGTLYILEYSKKLKIKRFLFASSVAASKFPGKNEKINEKSILDSNHPYSKSKKEGERLVQEFAEYFPCSVVRFAAVFTDWCEYGPLYIFLKTWNSKKWNSNILAGKGKFAIPYIHSTCLCQILLTIFLKSKGLPRYDVYIAGPDGSTSHKELFEVSTRYFAGNRINPVFVPNFIATIGVIARDIWGFIIGRRPFEKYWMMKYSDKALNIESSYTRKMLDWTPTPRFGILRRLLYIIETMKNDSALFHSKNTTALLRTSRRGNYIIYEVMVRLKEDINIRMKELLLDNNRNEEFSHYQSSSAENLNWDISVFYQLLTASVRNHDRFILLNYLRDILVPIRFREGFKSHEVCNAILETGKIIISIIIREPELKGMEQLVHDNIAMTIQLAVDEVENAFEKLSETPSIAHTPHRADVEKKLQELATFYTATE